MSCTQWSHTHFSCAVWLSASIGTTGFTTFSFIRHFLALETILNCVLMYRPRHSMVFAYRSGPSLPVRKPTTLKCSRALLFPPWNFFASLFYWRIASHHADCRRVCFCCLMVPSLLLVISNFMLKIQNWPSIQLKLTHILIKLEIMS